MLGEENQCKGDDYLGQVFPTFIIGQTLINLMSASKKCAPFLRSENFSKNGFRKCQFYVKV